ncbi:uncharacterized protein ISCGN_032950 [Ixodes scapularis]
MALFLAEMSRLLQEQRRPLPPLVPTPRTGTLRLHAEIPKYSGYADRKSVADFLDELREYQAVSEMSEVELLSRVLPIALTGSAATWRRRQSPFSTLQDFSEQFKNEFLPPDYGARMLDELRARTQHRDESLVEFVRALQTLYDRADPSASDSDKVSRAIRQSHPQFHPYLRGRVFRSLDELAQAAHQIQADILAELRYRPPPPPEACLEPSCAWTGTTRQSMDEHGSRPVLPGRVPRALDPYTHGLGDGAQVREHGRQYQAPSRERYPRATSATLRCFRCGSLGHFRRDCTRRVSNDNSGNEALGHPTVSVLQQSRPSLTSSPAGGLL